jgi:hypothetical protein
MWNQRGEWMVKNLSRSGQTAHWVILIFLLLMGFILGTILGEILRPYIPLLAKGASAEITPQTLRLADTFSLTFGVRIHLNLATIIGVITAFIIYRRL